MYSKFSKYSFLRWIVWSFMLAQTLHYIRCQIPEEGKFMDSSESVETDEFPEPGDSSKDGFFTEGSNFTEEDAEHFLIANRTRSRFFDLILTGHINETYLHEAILDNAPYLRSIYISQAPLLRRLPALPLLPELRTIRIINSGLEEIPDLRHIHDGSDKNALLQMIDFVGNRIKKIPSNAFRVRADQLILDYNQIEEISAYAFKGSELHELSLKNNPRLTRLHDQAFAGVKSIRELDLSETAITNMPTKGLEHLEVLFIEKVPSLKVIPSVYELQHLHTARLTHHFHCCAFKFPARHDPARHAEHEQKIANIRQRCEEKRSQDEARKRHKRHLPETSDSQELDMGKFESDEVYKKLLSTVARDMTSEEISNESSDRVDRKPTNGFNAGSDESEDFSAWGTMEKATDDESTMHFPGGTFHGKEVELENRNINAFCGNITIKRTPVSCTPVPDPLNPCEDVMGWRWLRLCVWLVIGAAVAGNAAVALVLLSNRADLTVPKMLMCHLAFADLCTGLYLLLLASVDVASYGEYFNYAYDWQYGPGCKVAGFLSVFSGQLSVYALAVITLERWFAITFAIYLNRRIDLKAATKIMIGGWLFALMMAGLPLAGVSDYSSTSICLPAESQNATDAAYQAMLFTTSATAFAVIVVCYIQIYRSLGTDTRRNSTQTNDRSIAKKMSLLIATDFLCWAPVAFFGVTALAGYPLVDVSHSKVLLVFFYPLNACANPFLYAILTQQYQRDFVYLLARYGLCTKTAQKYKIGYSLPTTNNTHPIPLIPRPTLETSVSKDLLPNTVAEAAM